jgi:hypothetical protein
MHDDVTHLVRVRPGRDHLTYRTAVERCIEAERRRIGLDVVHAATHVGIYGHELVPDQNLAFAQLGQLRGCQAEVLRSGAAYGT